jgi:DNA-binding MarR family transcriptional regulator
VKNIELSRADTRLLTSLADFRYALRQFLHFSETSALEAGMQPQQHQLILQVAGAPATAVTTVAFVAERLGLKHNSAVELVDRSEREGLVARDEDPTDRRRAIVRLTRKGERLLDRLAGDHAQELRVMGPRLIENLERVRLHAEEGR